ncbi:hypothetical protein ACFQZT_25530 [Paenibacillus sp. GCM10027628]|uniref:hypothetical protein n=1 Tax=Paenibacillus sp. GCM10027628 TaxID=3273413 RepID=UPI0036445813
MEYLLNEINENKLINKFNYVAFSCSERPRWILRENIKKYASYYYFLFHELKSGFLETNFDEFVRTKTQTDIYERYEASDHFHSDLAKIIKERKYTILTINLSCLFEPESQEALDQNGENHPHFTILKGVDAKEVLVIDEDFSKEYWVVSNRINGMDYVEQTFDIQKFKRMCYGAEQIDFVKTNKPSDMEGNMIHFHEVINLNQETECNIHEIANSYYSMLTELCHKNQAYELAIIGGFKELIRNFDQYPSFNSKEFYLHDYGPYPKELHMYMVHMNSLQIKQRFLNQVLSESPELKKLNELFDPILNNYQLIKSLLRKSFVAEDKGILNTVIEKYIIGLANKENALYGYILQNKLLSQLTETCQHPQSHVIN